MNPMVQEAAASIVRAVLKGVAGYLVARGVWSQGDAANYVAALALFLVGQGWSFYTSYGARIKLLVAAKFAGLTENQVEQHVATATSLPSVTTSPAVVPVNVGVVPPKV